MRRDYCAATPPDPRRRMDSILKFEKKRKKKKKRELKVKLHGVSGGRLTLFSAGRTGIARENESSLMAVSYPILVTYPLFLVENMSRFSFSLRFFPSFLYELPSCRGGFHCFKPTPGVCESGRHLFWVGLISSPLKRFHSPSR